MNNVVETPDGNLSKGMRQLNGVYTQSFNKRDDRIGRLFQGRYKAILVSKEKIREAVMEYGYGQNKIAEQLGMHYSTISKLLNGREKYQKKNLTPCVRHACVQPGPRTSNCIESD
jgi:DNA-binding XRE family transcriptional regulator